MRMTHELEGEEGIGRRYRRTAVAEALGYALPQRPNGARLRGVLRHRPVRHDARPAGLR